MLVQGLRIGMSLLQLCPVMIAYLGTLSKVLFPAGKEGRLQLTNWIMKAHASRAL